jgi:hypothetical protein
MGRIDGHSLREMFGPHMSPDWEARWSGLMASLPWIFLLWLCNR